MQKIVPHLWFDTHATDAAAFYVDTFGKDSKIVHTGVIRGTPSGDCDVVTFNIWGFDFMGISAGPAFKINPSISFMVNFDPSVMPNAKETLDAIWNKLSAGGMTLMPLDTYPFSDHYGWVMDKYGVSWQLILTKPEGEPRPPILPSMMFTGDLTGKAEEAIDFYVANFNDSKRGITAPYPPGTSPEPSAKIMFAEFMIEKQWFTAMDSGHMHPFTFNEAVSLLVRCESQQEIDDYSHKLSADPAAEQCGWLKDKYGVSWQVSSSSMEEMLRSNDQAAVDRVVQAFLPMKRLDLAALECAFKGA